MAGILRFRRFNAGIYIRFRFAVALPMFFIRTGLYFHRTHSAALRVKGVREVQSSLFCGQVAPFTGIMVFCDERPLHLLIFQRFIRGAGANTVAVTIFCQPWLVLTVVRRGATHPRVASGRDIFPSGICPGAFFFRRIFCPPPFRGFPLARLVAGIACFWASLLVGFFIPLPCLLRGPLGRPLLWSSQRTEESRWLFSMLVNTHCSRRGASCGTHVVRRLSLRRAAVVPVSVLGHHHRHCGAGVMWVAGASARTNLVCHLWVGLMFPCYGAGFISLGKRF